MSDGVRREWYEYTCRQCDKAFVRCEAIGRYERPRKGRRSEVYHCLALPPCVKYDNDDVCYYPKVRGSNQACRVFELADREVET